MIQSEEKKRDRNDSTVSTGDARGATPGKGLMCVFFLMFCFSFWFAKPRALNEVCLQLFAMATDDRNHIYFLSCQFRHENTDVIKPTTHCAHRDYVIFCQSKELNGRSEWTKKYVNESGNRCACGFVNSNVHFYCLFFCFFLSTSSSFLFNSIANIPRVFFLSIDETNALRINSQRVQCFNAANNVASV